MLLHLMTHVQTMTHMDQDNKYYWLLGLILAVLAAIVSNLGLNLQKLLHLRNTKLNEADRKNYFKHGLWRMGLALVIIGSIADLAALVFAPQSTIAPIGSLTLVANAVFAPILLKEKTTTLDTFATCLIVIGASVSVGFASHRDVVYGVHELFSFFEKPIFLIYAGVMIAYMAILYVAIKKMELQEAIDPSSAYYLSLKPYHRFSYASLSGTVGAQSVLFAKCMSELMVDSFEHKGFMFAYYQSYVVIALMFTCIFLQIGWLNDGLRRFDSSYTVPVFTAFWILVSVVSGMVFYREYEGMSSAQGYLFVLGVSITISGVTLLSRREITPLVTDERGETKEGVDGYKPKVAQGADTTEKVKFASNTDEAAQNYIKIRFADEASEPLLNSC